MKSSLLRSKFDQSRRVERHSATPNQRQATPSGQILVSTRRAKAIFTFKRHRGSPNGVICRFCNKLHRTPSALTAKKRAIGSGDFININRS